MRASANTGCQYGHLNSRVLNFITSSLNMKKAIVWLLLQLWLALLLLVLINDILIFIVIIIIIVTFAVIIAIGMITTLIISLLG